MVRDDMIMIGYIINMNTIFLKVNLPNVNYSVIVNKINLDIVTL